MSRQTGSSPNWCIRHGDGYLTTIELAWEIGAKGSGLFLYVPADFPFNVSIPWWALPVFSRHDPRYLKAAALHDYALHRLGWGRVSAAAPFSEALRAAGVSRIRRLAMVLAVTIHKWR